MIATPAETHFNLAREALLAGKHVFVEKPLVLDENEGLELIGLAEKEHRTLMVGHLLQYHPVFVKLKELERSGELGRINYIYSHRLNLGKIRREENILWSFAPHDISMILGLAGEEAESVQATGGNYLHQKIADVTTTHLEFPSGLQAHIFVSWLHPFKEQKLVVVGDRKMAVFDDTLPWQDKLLLYPHKINWQNNMPVPTKGEPERVDISQDEPLKLECLHFLECMQNGKKPTTDGREGLSVLKILKASQLSLDQNGRKIDLKRMAKEAGTAYWKTRVHLFILRLLSTRVSLSVPVQKSGIFLTFFPALKLVKTATSARMSIIGPDVSIGKNCKIQNNVSVYKGVTLEDGVFCGPVDGVHQHIQSTGGNSKNGPGQADTGKTWGHPWRQFDDRLRNHVRTIQLCRCRSGCHPQCAGSCPGDRQSCQTNRLDV